MSELLQSKQSPPAAGFAFLNLGFRPFYWLASVFAAISIALWVAEYAGMPGLHYVGNPLWHAHEMLFGYTIAVIVGFLFTAVRNWTARPTPTGATLAALVLLWAAGRVLVLTPYAVAAAIVNAAFPIAAAIGIAVPLFGSGNRRNYFFVGLLVVIGLAVLGFYLSQAGVVTWPALLTVQVGLDVVLFVMAVMAGRVVPMFTNNAIAGADASRRASVEKAALGLVILLFLADVVGAPALAIALVALLGAVMHGVRLALWHPWRTRGTPLVWILHVSYAWIVLYLALRAGAAAGAVPDSIAIHALTIGGIGGLTLGMMTRTARGHTGRPLAAGSLEVTAYLLLEAAALVRVFGGWLLPSMYLASVVLSALCWTAAFALYAVGYWPVLARPRLDGKPG